MNRFSRLPASVALIFAVSVVSVFANLGAQQQQNRANDDEQALADACDAAAETWREQVSDDFATLVKPPFVLLGVMTEKKLAGYYEHTVLRGAQALWNTYFDKRPDEPITIFLFNGQDDYKTWAKKLFGDTDISYYGYYKPSKRALVMDVSTGTGTLVHELTHALMDFDFPDVPTWFNEGLASLYEQCRYGENDTITGLANWRLPALQEALKDDTLRSLEDLVTKNDFRGRLEGLNYAQARYFCMYLQEQGLLEEFYQTFRDGYDKDETGLSHIEKVCDDTIENIDRDYRAWAAKLKRG